MIDSGEFSPETGKSSTKSEKSDVEEDSMQ